MESKKINLSIALAVYNEESNLGECLKTVKDIAEEIVIVDGQSTDQTIEIAKSFGAKIISEENRTNFHINKQHAIDNCHGDWILQLDADERVSPMLASEINSVINNPSSCDAYYLKRRNYFLGRWMNKGGMYPDPVIRLFRRGKASLPQKNVHELMEVTGSLCWLNNDLLHIADPLFSRYLLRSDRYTTLQADEWFKEGKIGTSLSDILLYLLLKPFGRFCSIYFRHKGLLDGFPGFIFAWYSGIHIASSYVKYWEQKHGTVS